MHTNNTKFSAFSQRQRGSALLTALLFAFFLTAISGSFLKLAINERKMAARTQQNHLLLNLAEGAAEQGIYAIKSGSWDNWQKINSGKDMYLSRQRVVMGTRSQDYHILIQNYDSAPVIYAEALGTVMGDDMNKQVMVVFTDSVPSPGGLISKGKLELSGGYIYIDSYNSNLGKWNKSTNRSDEVTVATVSTQKDMYKANSEVEIYGFAGTGKPNITKDSKFWVWGTDTGKKKYDSDRVSNDFTFDFPSIDVPSKSGAKSVNLNNKSKTLSTGTYKTSNDITYSSRTLTIDGDVVIIADGSVDISGKGKIKINPGASLKLYTPSDVTLSGGAIVNNTAQPKNMEIYGTSKKANDQTMSLSGQGMIEAVTYMPNGKLNFSGQAQYSGSAIANEVTFSGQVQFHYDTSLGESGSGADGVSDWAELARSTDQIDIEAYVKKMGGKV